MEAKINISIHIKRKIRKCRGKLDGLEIKQHTISTKWLLVED